MPLDNDPLWYKDAIIYELHVRAFSDSNDDGIGDFKGLVSKLDYLRDLGITCIWLLPFYPSPLRDDGYDIADYHGVHPNYGSLKDFKLFVREAHDRGIRVITELVINHTSDQHPWFQAARKAKPGSAQHKFYVWSQTNSKFPETRIIFTDTERSNWTWDEEAGSYYWHRFFHHQPDLNHNNPQVVKAVIKVLKFWFETGVDGLRLDAVPYLCVREGTNNENLPETHGVIKEIRKAIDNNFENRMLLAEANQWPEDVRAYFGDNDECHMAFHFPLMPRIFMAIRKEDRHPITEIIARTPEIPYACQWGLFLRNHDELTLEMVTDDERDYMYKEYAYDPRMRVNVGIRRRLAPLVDNDITTIQMLNSLLFSFPGTPILYYGDEIGMGDNIYLGDRDGVRTPMQWSPDRNAGFSRADPARLYKPLVMDAVYGYQSVNVEAQERSPSSLLNFMKRIISIRRQYKAFGRGTLEFLHPANRKILAYIRRYKQEVILCLVNLSKQIQPVELDLSEFKDMTPLEIFGKTEFPPIGELPYFLTLGPNAFYWFKLEPPVEPIPIRRLERKEELSSLRSIDLEAGWDRLWEAGNLYVMEQDILPTYLPRQHWYIHTGQQVDAVKVLDYVKLGANFYFIIVKASYSQGSVSHTYVIPLKISVGIIAEALLNEIPEAILATVKTSKGQGVLFDALFDESACTTLLTHIENERFFLSNMKGRMSCQCELTPEELRRYENEALNVYQITPKEKSTWVFYDNWMVLKMYRSVLEGINPDLEVRQFLVKAGFTRVPRFTGLVDYTPQGGKQSQLIAAMHEFIDSDGDAWTFTQVIFKNFLQGDALSDSERDAIPMIPHTQWANHLDSPVPDPVIHSLGDYYRFFTLLGERTAEMHAALVGEKKDKNFTPEKITTSYLEDLSERFASQVQQLFESINASLIAVPEANREAVNHLLLLGAAFSDYMLSLRDVHPNTLRTRIHGNLCLENILYKAKDFIFLDFDGDVHLPVEERRRKHTPLMDIVYLLSSIYRASDLAVCQIAIAAGGSGISEPYRRWTLAWQQWITIIFLKSYYAHVAGLNIAPEDRQARAKMMTIMLFNRELSELERLLTMPEKPIALILERLQLLSQVFGIRS